MNNKSIFGISIGVLGLVVAMYILVPFFTGEERILIVLSGSMTPLMLPGDMIVIKDVSPENLNPEDVMAFQYTQPDGSKVFVTHRIVSIEEGDERIFKTKGDANEEEDDFFVPASDLVGKLIFVIPFAGYLPGASKNKKVLLATIIIPSILLIFEELKTIIIYSSPARARKAENEQRKLSRRTFYRLEGKRLFLVLLTGGLFFTGLVLENIGETGSIVLEEQNVVENPGFLSGVHVLTPENLQQRLSIEPWYAVTPPKNATLVKAPEGTPVTISSVPYILPVFWIVTLSELNPFYPSVAEILIYTCIFMLFMLPFWYKKSVYGQCNIRIRVNRALRQWRRTFHSL
jgi:signal peptidase